MSLIRSFYVHNSIIGHVASVMQGKASSARFYEDYMNSVIDYVPEDRLLVFDVREGWEPLCDFLQMPVPKTEFPMWVGEVVVAA